MKDVDIISKVVGRKGEAMASPSKDAASVNLSAYLLKEIWDKCWEIRTTDKGEEYLFGKLPVGLQFDLSSFVDGGLINLPTLYDGLPIDGQTIKWKEVTNEDGSVTRVLESVGSGGTTNKVTWDNIEGKPDFSNYATKDYVTDRGYLTRDDISVLVFEIGDEIVHYDPSDPPMPNQITVSIPTKLSDLENDFDLKYLSVDGGELYGDLWMRSYSDTDTYGRRIIFGDKHEDGEPYVYLGEDEDNELTLFAKNGIVDPISLALCFENNADERIESSIEEYLEGYKW
jgi:hypothetical protein